MKGNFNSIISSDKPVLIDFHAVWCGPCKSQSTILQELSRETGNSVRIIKVDIDKNKNIARRYNVNSVPTLALFKSGEKLWQQSGLQTKHALKSIIAQHS